MSNIFKLSGFFVCLEGPVKFSVPGGQKQMLGCGLLGEISTQADTMNGYVIITCPEPLPEIFLAELPFNQSSWAQCISHMFLHASIYRVAIQRE